MPLHGALPDLSNFQIAPIQRERNYGLASKTTKKLDSQWKNRLEKLLDNTDDQDDYFQVYSEGSNNSISTICIVSNDSRYTDCSCSDTDVTRREDIVIELSEKSFYNAKVNPFPQQNFPPVYSLSERNASNIIEGGKDFEDDNNEEDVTAPGDVEKGVEESQNEEDVTAPGDVEKVVEEEQNEKDSAAPSDAEESQNEKESAAPGDVEKDVEEEQNEKDSAAPSDVEEVVNKEDVTAPGDVKKDVEEKQNEEDSAAPGDVEKVVEEEQNEKDSAAPGDAEESQNEKESAAPVDVGKDVADQKQENNLAAADNVKDDKLKSSQTDNSGLAQRKKHYTAKNRNAGKCLDYDRQKQLKRQHSDTSTCTKITSTTTIRVTTNDDEIFEALEDMPDFINTSVVDLASSYIDERLRPLINLSTRYIDFESDLNFVSSSSTSSITSSSLWLHKGISSSNDDEYISPPEAYKQLNTLLSDGTDENLNALLYDEYNEIRFDNEIPSSEEDFISDLDDLDLTNQKWRPPESKLRRQVAKILEKIHPMENDYGVIIDDMLCKYLNYIDKKQRTAKMNRIVNCVNRPLSQHEKTDLLIRKEIEDKKLNRPFCYTPMEPPEFTELAERRREAIYRKYAKCHNDRTFCHNYFKQSIEDRPISKLAWRVAKLKKELGLIFA